MASGSMFGIRISDRLKAAVNTFDAAGTALQQRAIGQPPKDGGPRPISPNAPFKLPSAASSPVPSPVVEKNQYQNQPESPTRTTSGHYVASTSALAENALSGLRKSFNFGGRPSVDGHRPTASITQSSSLKELEDIPTTPAQASGSRPSSPARSHALNAPQFTLGSDPSSMAATPQPSRSPGPTQINLAPRSPRSSPRQPLPPPGPSDPATYPLPPSPPLSPSSPLLFTSTVYADPLGVSPLLDSHETAEPPELGLTEPTPSEEKGVGVIGLGMEGVETAPPDQDVVEDQEFSGSTEEIAENGKPPEIDPELERKLAAAERRYEGVSHMTQNKDRYVTDPPQTSHSDLRLYFNTSMTPTRC